MVKSCSVADCSQRFQKGISFHKFPKDNTIRNEWVRALNRNHWKPSPYSVLCSRHFTPDSYEQSGWSSYRALKPTAIPTIFSAYSKMSERIAQLHFPESPPSSPSIAIHESDSEFKGKKTTSYNNKKADSSDLSDAEIQNNLKIEIPDQDTDVPPMFHFMALETIKTEPEPPLSSHSIAIHESDSEFEGKKTSYNNQKADSSDLSGDTEIRNNLKIEIPDQDTGVPPMFHFMALETIKTEPESPTNIVVDVDVHSITSELDSEPERKKKKRKCYVGDFDMEDIHISGVAQDYFNVLKDVISQKNQKIKILQERIRRLKSKLYNVEQLVARLQHK